jgi:hypothetical protein
VKGLLDTGIGIALGHRLILEIYFAYRFRRSGTRTFVQSDRPAPLTIGTADGRGKL